MKRAAVVVVALLCGSLAVGCKGMKTGAQQNFAREFTCPEDRVEVRPRTEIRPSDLKTKSTPSKEIAADPQRLKIWQTAKDESDASENSLNEVFEARGCDHQALYSCHRHNKQPNTIMCSSRDYPAGVTKW
jgi:hypothetical protein